MPHEKSLHIQIFPKCPYLEGGKNQFQFFVFISILAHESLKKKKPLDNRTFSLLLDILNSGVYWVLNSLLRSIHISDHPSLICLIPVIQNILHKTTYNCTGTKQRYMEHETDHNLINLEKGRGEVKFWIRYQHNNFPEIRKKQKMRDLFSFRVGWFPFPKQFQWHQISFPFHFDGNWRGP